jgi:hypothetical protein
MSLLRDLSELVEAKVISEATALNIKQHFDRKSSPTYNRLLIVFGILGALLTGLGIILIIAHNWDTLSHNIKLMLAILPLVIAQLLCGYILMKRSDSVVLREATSTFLVLSIAASIALISQIYNMESDLPAFLLIWTTISIPVIYIMRASMPSMIVLIAITWYACSLSYFQYPNVIAWRYWILLAAVVPHYVMLYRADRKSNFFHFHTWLLVLSTSITLGMFGKALDLLTVLTYLNLFSIFILIDELGSFDQNRISISAFRVVGNFGTLGIFLSYTFKEFWEEFAGSGDINLIYTIASYPFWILIIVAIILLVSLVRRQTFSKVEPMSYAFVTGLLLFLLCNLSTDASWILTNIIVLIFGVYTIRKGARLNMLGIMNFGLMIIAALIISRFFDLDLTYVTRGILFIGVGLSFFFMNFYMIRKRSLQKNDNQTEL